jgi:hypothetical protein
MTTFELLTSAERELKKRQRVYPNLVEEGTMTQKRATHETSAMEEICDILRAKWEAEAITPPWPLANGR